MRKDDLMRTEVYDIEGMSCAACSSAVERVTRKLEGVESSDVNLTTNKMTITYDETKVTPEMIMGISVKAREKEAAELFVSFLFSEEQQKNNKEAGFPVRKSVYDSEEYWELGQEGNIEYGFSSTYNGESHDMITVVHSADDQIKEIQKLGKILTMPSGGSRIIQDSVLEAGKRYLYGGTDLDKAVEQAVSQVKLYLAE